MRNRWLSPLVALLTVALVLPAPAVLADTLAVTSRTYTEVTATTTQDFGTAEYKTAPKWDISYTTGTGLNQANKIFIDKITLAGSGSTNYDLDGTLTGPLGSVSFTRIVSVKVRRTTTPAASTQDENLTIGGDFVLTKYLIGWVDDALTIPLHPGGVWSFDAPNSTGVAITATTGDVLTITNASSADSCEYEIVIVGS